MFRVLFEQLEELFVCLYTQMQKLLSVSLKEKWHNSIKHTGIHITFFPALLLGIGTAVLLISDLIGTSGELMRR